MPHFHRMMFIVPSAFISGLAKKACGCSLRHAVRSACSRFVANAVVIR
jgi:hypothetical protein